MNESNADRNEERENHHAGDPGRSRKVNWAFLYTHLPFLFSNLISNAHRVLLQRLEKGLLEFSRK